MSANDDQVSVPARREPKMRPFRFQLTHLLYATAVLGASIGVLGAGGVIVAAIVLGFWFLVFWGLINRTEMFVILLFLIVLSCVLFPPIESSGPPRRSYCRNNLKQIGLGLHNYHDVYGSFPPPYLADAEGKPMHSWRVLILPFTENLDLYDKYDFDEPWDGPDNSKLHSEMPTWMRCPTCESYNTTTSYVAVTGNDSGWSETGKKLSEFSSASSTVIVIERSDHGIHWMEPRDFSVEEAVAQWGEPEKEGNGHWSSTGMFTKSFQGSNALMADGSCDFCEATTSKRTMSKLFSCKEILDSVDYEYDENMGTTITDYGKLTSLFLLIGLALFPVLKLGTRERKHPDTQARKTTSS